MTEYKTVYLIVERGLAPHKLKFWRIVGSALVCRDGSLNMKLDIHPGLTFNIREAKHPDEIRSAVADTWPETNGKPVKSEEAPSVLKSKLTQERASGDAAPIAERRK